MKVIDLLNKIANGEEVPKKIKFDNKEYENEPCYMLYEATGERSELQFKKFLNDEVEIIEEEKKIPEKLDVISWDKCIHGVTHKEKELAIEINKTQELLNQVIDYLKSKGE